MADQLEHGTFIELIDGPLPDNNPGDRVTFTVAVMPQSWSPDAITQVMLSVGVPGEKPKLYGLYDRCPRRNPDVELVECTVELPSSKSGVVEIGWSWDMQYSMEDAKKNFVKKGVLYKLPVAVKGNGACLVNLRHLDHSVRNDDAFTVQAIVQPQSYHPGAITQIYFYYKDLGSPDDDDKSCQKVPIYNAVPGKNPMPKNVGCAIHIKENFVGPIEVGWGATMQYKMEDAFNSFPTLSHPWRGKLGEVQVVTDEKFVHHTKSLPSTGRKLLGIDTCGMDHKMQTHVFDQMHERAVDFLISQTEEAGYNGHATIHKIMKDARLLDSSVERKVKDLFECARMRVIDIIDISPLLWEAFYGGNEDGPLAGGRGVRLAAAIEAFKENMKRQEIIDLLKKANKDLTGKDKKEDTDAVKEIKRLALKYENRKVTKEVVEWGSTEITDVDNILKDAEEEKDSHSIKKIKSIVEMMVKNGKDKHKIGHLLREAYKEGCDDGPVGGRGVRLSAAVMAIVDGKMKTQEIIELLQKAREGDNTSIAEVTDLALRAVNQVEEVVEDTATDFGLNKGVTKIVEKAVVYSVRNAVTSGYVKYNLRQRFTQYWRRSVRLPYEPLMQAEETNTADVIVATGATDMEGVVGSLGGLGAVGTFGVGLACAAGEAGGEYLGGRIAKMTHVKEGSVLSIFEKELGGCGGSMATGGAIGFACGACLGPGAGITAALGAEIGAVGYGVGFIAKQGVEGIKSVYALFSH